MRFLILHNQARLPIIFPRDGRKLAINSNTYKKNYKLFFVQTEKEVNWNFGGRTWSAHKYSLKLWLPLHVSSFFICCCLAIYFFNGKRNFLFLGSCKHCYHDDGTIWDSIIYFMLFNDNYFFLKNNNE